MNEDLPTEFDVVVIGTGMVESILAAASSRIGKTVLHLDSNDFYGGFWASFNLENISNYIEKCKDYLEEEGNQSIENDILKLDKSFSKIGKPKELWNLREEEEDSQGWTKEKVLKEFRKFNIDLSPKLLFARGMLVEVLISSNICRYAEFRAVDHVTTLMDDRLISVPCSRADVFTSKSVNVVEKRLLMKLLNSCMAYEDGADEFKNFESKSFLQYLKHNKLTNNLIHYIMYAISMGDEKTSFKDGMIETKKFLTSLGRYGNTPFLFPMYGCGEIPQCFCRLCAVFGGIYCLKRPIDELKFSDGKIESIKCNNQVIKADKIILGHGIAPKGILMKENPIKTDFKKCGNLSRSVFITSTPLGGDDLNKGGGGVSLLKIPPLDGSSHGGAFVIYLSHYSGTCPKGLYLTHLTCETIVDAETDLKPYINKIFIEEDNPNISWSLYFNIPSCVKCDNSEMVPADGVSLCCCPFFELDFDQSIQQAKDIFKNIYPDEEFLPRAPDPEEIVIEGDENRDNVDDGFLGDALEENSLNERLDVEAKENTEENN